MRLILFAFLPLLAACGAPHAATVTEASPPLPEFCQLAENTVPAEMLSGGGPWEGESPERIGAEGNRYLWYTAEYPRCFDDAARDALFLGADMSVAEDIALRACSRHLQSARYHAQAMNRVARAMRTPNWDEEERSTTERLEQLQSIGWRRVYDLILCKQANHLREG